MRAVSCRRRFASLRTLLDRLEDSATGRVLPAGVSRRRFPTSACGRRSAAAAIMGDTSIRKYPFAGGTQPMVADRAEALLNRTWRPALSVIGADGLPPIANAGNVLRPQTSLKLSLRLPPTVDGDSGDRRRCRRCSRPIRPHGASGDVSTADEGATGWNAPPTAPWLEARARRARRRRSTASRRRRWARAARFRSWRCWASISRSAVPDHRRARPEIQCARPERVPARPVRDEADRVRRAPFSPRTRRARTTLTSSPPARARAANTSCLPPRERANQQPGDVGVERRTRRRFDEPAELAVVACRPEPAPVADHVHVGAIAEHRPLANRGERRRTASVEWRARANASPRRS